VLRSFCHLLVYECVIHVLHSLQFAEPLFLALKRPFRSTCTIFRYIEILLDLAICLPTRNRVAVLWQPFPGHNSYSFLSIHAEFPSHRLWILITFFGSVVLHHIFGKVLDTYQYHSPKFCFLFALSQKS
jgi:hypothetical protein